MVHLLSLHASTWSGSGHGFDHGRGTQILPAARGMAKKKKKIRNNIEKIMNHHF